MRSGDRLLVRERTIGEGFLGSFDPRLLFGVAEAGPVEVAILWPDGVRSVLSAVELDQEIVASHPGLD